MSVPPAAISQTSFPSHTGPIERSTRRRSASERATTRWIAPAPRSKPSRITYMIPMKASRQNQRSPMPASVGRPLGLGAVRDLAINEEESEQGEERVHARQAAACETRVASGDERWV